MSDESSNWSDFEDEEFDSDYKENSFLKEGLVLLIDAGENMFKEEDEETPFYNCLKCLKALVQNKIIQRREDLISILFFSTEKSKNEPIYENIYEFQPLEEPNTKMMTDLEKLMEELEDPKQVSPYGYSPFTPLPHMLTLSLDVLAKKDCLSWKRIIIFTNNDKPQFDSSQQILLENALKKAEEQHVMLELIPLYKKDSSFFSNPFYKKMLSEEDEEEEGGVLEVCKKFEDISFRLRTKLNKGRFCDQLLLHLGPHLSASVQIYQLTVECNKPPLINICKKTNQEVKISSKMVVKGTEDEVSREDSDRLLTICGRKFLFTDEEIEEIVTFAPEGIYVIGLMDESSFDTNLYLSPSLFLYPDPTLIKGSKELLAYLLNVCLKKSLVLWCQFIANGNPPKIAVLLPCSLEKNKNTNEISLSGFHLYFVPYCEDLRTIDLPCDLPRANKEEIEKSKELIKKLQFTFNCENFENPILQYFLLQLESLALQRPLLDDFSDFVQPVESKIEKRVGGLMKQLRDLVTEDCTKFKKLSAKKMKTNNDGDEDEDGEDDEEDGFFLEEEAKEGRLEKLTVAKLKERMKKENIISMATRKADLIKAIKKHYNI